MYVHICIAIGFSWHLCWDLWLWRNSMILGIFAMRLWCSHLGMRPRTREDAKGGQGWLRGSEEKHQTKPDEDCTIQVLTMAISQNLQIELDGNFWCSFGSVDTFWHERTDRKLLCYLCVFDKLATRYTWCTGPLFILQLVFYRQASYQDVKRSSMYILNNHHASIWCRM